MTVWRMFQGVFIVLDVIDTYQTIKWKQLGHKDKNWIINKLKKPWKIAIYSVIMFVIAIGLMEVLRSWYIIAGWVLLMGWIGLKVYCIWNNWRVMR
jgi:hypothetical protein